MIKWIIILFKFKFWALSWLSVSATNSPVACLSSLKPTQADFNLNKPNGYQLVVFGRAYDDDSFAYLTDLNAELQDSIDSQLLSRLSLLFVSVESQHGTSFVVDFLDNFDLPWVGLVGNQAALIQAGQCWFSHLSATSHSYYPQTIEEALSPSYWYIITDSGVIKGVINATQGLDSVQNELYELLH